MQLGTGEKSRSSDFSWGTSDAQSSWLYGRLEGWKLEPNQRGGKSHDEQPTRSHARRGRHIPEVLILSDTAGEFELKTTRSGVSPMLEP